MVYFDSYELDYKILSFLEENKNEWFTIRQLYDHFDGEYSYKSINNNVKSLYKHGLIVLVNDEGVLKFKYKDFENNYFTFLKKAFNFFKNRGLKKKNF